jgi:hypothetical protein
MVFLHRDQICPGFRGVAGIGGALTIDVEGVRPVTEVTGVDFEAERLSLRRLAAGHKFG